MLIFQLNLFLEVIRKLLHSDYAISSLQNELLFSNKFMQGYTLPFSFPLVPEMYLINSSVLIRAYSPSCAELQPVLPEQYIHSSPLCGADLWNDVYSYHYKNRKKNIDY